MLKKIFLEYRNSRNNKSLTLPGFFGFIADQQPKWYKSRSKRDIKNHPDYKLIEDIIHGVVTDGLLDGKYKADSYLRNYHGWVDKQVIDNISSLTIDDLYD